MIDIKELTNQVRHNCDISDAQHAGLYSICGLALRLRDLYKWENGLPPWEEKDSSEILDWIAEKEQRWERLLDSGYRNVIINGSAYEPFDTQGINAALVPDGIYYGAGYAHSLKPTFLLARIESREAVNGHPVVSLGQELARDLLTIPALSQDNCIVLRQEAARLFIWDQISYINKSGRPALKFALNRCGLDDQTNKALRRNLNRILAIQKTIYIDHEIGEMTDTAFPRDIWREIIAAYPHTVVELAARTVKDLLADTGTSGTLHGIIRRRDAAALGFFTAFFDGLATQFFPQLRPAFNSFAQNDDWQVIEDALCAGHRSARCHAEQMINIYREGQQRQQPQWAEKEIEKQVLGDIPSKR